jgi:hypothetical protein
VYLALAWGGEANPVPQELFRWQLAERFGWTLEYIDNLSVGDMHELIQVDDGRRKAEASRRKK